MKMNLRNPAILLLFIAHIFVVATFGQTQPSLENGFKPYGSYNGSELDTVNLVNGNLMLHLPVIPVAPQRGGRIGVNYALYVTSKGWMENCQRTTCVWTMLGSGVSLLATEEVTVHRQLLMDSSGGTTTYGASGYSVMTADGATHKLFPVPGATTEFEVVDGSGYHVSLSNTDATTSLPGSAVVINRQGSRYEGNFLGQGACSGRPGSPVLNVNGYAGIIDNFPLENGKSCPQRTIPVRTLDSDGNQITFSAPDSALPGLDTLGRNFLHWGGYIQTTDATGCTASAPFAFAQSVSYTGPNNVANQVKLCFGNFNIATTFSVSGVAEAPAQTLQLITTAIRADGARWTFNYDNFANVISVGLPQGGSINYGWTTVSSGGAGHRAVSTRTLVDNHGHSSTWSYQWGSYSSNGLNVTNVVTDPSGNDTVHGFTVLANLQGPSPYETSTLTYQGPQSSGRLLQRVDTTYGNAQAISGTIGNVFPTSIQTTLYPSGKVSRIAKTYDTGLGTNAPSFGNVVTEKTYDWGAGSPGPLLRETDSSYMWQSDARYLTAHLLDLPASVVVKDGNGNRVAETDYAYDEAQYLTASNITSQHGSAPNAVRGHLTSVSHWLNPSNSMITSHTNWYDTGEVYQTLDPLGHALTHSYDSAYAGAYSTQSCDALSHCFSGTYDFNTGLLTSFTNANATSQASGTTPGDAAHTTNYAYDFMARMVSATLPADGAGNHPQTTFNYPDLTTVERLHKTTASLSDDAFTYFDGLGRTIQGKHVTPGGNALVDTTYDGLSRVASVTNPYFSSSDLTYGITQSQYDALGRVTRTIRQDGSFSTVSYSDNCTTATDEAGKQRRACTDALGRLMEVDEPGTVPPQNNHATLQTDGNFVVYNPAGTALWSTGTAGTGSSPLEMQDDGNLVLYTFKWQAGVYATPASGPFPPQTCSIGMSLNAPQTLAAGQCITSPRGQYMLYMATDGNFYIYDTAHQAATWSAGTYGNPGAYAVMQTDGNLVVYSPGGTALWSSGTGGTYAQKVEMEEDGRIILSRATWNSGTSNGQSGGSPLPHPGCDVGFSAGTTGTLATGQCLVSPNGRYELLLQSDGDLALYDLSANPQMRLWSAGTALSPVDPSVALRTLYSYDALGNLLCVEQHGGVTGTGCSASPSADSSSPWRVRRFTYDSLSRLLTASNPESGTISYSYDAVGNLLQKVMPSPNQTGTATHTISYCYDALNRVTGKAWSWQNCQNGQLPPGTAVVSYTYDQNPNGIGHLTHLTDQAGSGSYTYDILGRMSSESRTIAGVTKTLSYTYNLDGSVATATYPSGAAITYTPDAAGRTLKAVDSGNNINYVTGATYGPTSALTGSVYGQSSSFTGIVNSFSYNNRLQPATLWSSSPTRTLMYLVYDFHLGSGDNGNVWGITNNRDTTRNQTFTYDPLNRLLSAQNAGTDCTQKLVDGHTEYWGNSYVYDAWGNLNQKQVTKCSAENLSVTVNAITRCRTVIPTMPPAT